MSGKTLWLYDGGVSGPYALEEFLGRTSGSLDVLAARTETPPKSRWDWKPAFCFSELRALLP